MTGLVSKFVGTCEGEVHSDADFFHLNGSRFAFEEGFSFLVKDDDQRINTKGCTDGEEEQVLECQDDRQNASQRLLVEQTEDSDNIYDVAVNETTQQ